ncbi:MAG: glycosyltransferase family 9 protein [Kiritimatiellae bacterium]|nr:glycosyltransferase family 9 protein [Kiritimatiellia bacterium]
MRKNSTAKDNYRFRRLVDKTLGSVLLFCLGIVPRLRRRSRPAGVWRVALIKADGIGDVVLLTSVVQDLRAAWPGVHITLICGPFNYPFARILSCFDEVHCMVLTNPVRTILAMRRMKLDLCIDLGEWSRVEALIAFFCGARFTIGFDSPGQFRHYAHDLTSPHRRDQHEMDNYRELVRALGVPTTHPARIELAPDQEIPDEEKRRIAPPPYAVLQMWCGSATYARLKEWPPDRWAEVIRWLTERGCAVHLSGGRADTPRAQEFIARHTRPEWGVRDATALSFPGLIHLVRHAAVVISIDTCTTHIGGALGAPILGLHGPSSSKRWGALGPKARSLDTPVPGCGYMNWGADSTPEKAKLKCMEGITTEAVIAQLKEMLADQPAPPRTA